MLRGPAVDSYCVKWHQQRDAAEDFEDPIAELWQEEYQQLFGVESGPFVFDIPPPPAYLTQPGVVR